ncbi:MAG: divergent polysaccharide deacetylase family protein, partial [Candidatus Omnitrophota bacterium]
MARRKLFKLKFKLTRKQKRRLVTFLVLGLCVWGGFLLLKHLPQPAAPKVPPARQWIDRPKITFVIDDIGNHNRCNAQLKTLGRKITYAILPLLSYSRYYGDLSRKTGAEVILHLPLDTVQDKIPGRGLIVGTMSKEDILDMLARDLDSVPNHVGVNNHMGSRGTADREMMTTILTDLKRRHLFF